MLIQGLNALVRSKLKANQWIITARWYYLLVLSLISVAIRFEWFGSGQFFNDHLFTNGLLWIFLGLWYFNFILFLFTYFIKRGERYQSIPLLSFFQLLYTTVVMILLLFTVPGFDTVIPMIGFVIILEAIILFETVVPMYLAGVYVIGLNFFYVAQNSNLVFWLTGEAPAWQWNSINLEVLFAKALIVSTVYLLFGAWGQYLARLIKERGGLLAEVAASREKQIEELQAFNQQIEATARALRAKELELTSANKRLETLEQAKSNFISVTTHQMRTPLAAIKWTFSMLVKNELGPVTAEQKEFLEKGFAATEKMIVIVNDLLNVDRIEGKLTEYHFRPTDITKVLEGVTAEFSTQTHSKKISLTVEKPTGSLPLIECDEEKVRIVLENLIDNAVKYSPAGGTVVITLSDQKINSAAPALEIRVADSGAGIPTGDRDKVFHKFFRASNAISLEPDGTGVGLFIAKDIIEHHGGAIWFESGASGGTVFHLTLPVKQKAV